MRTLQAHEELNSKLRRTVCPRRGTNDRHVKEEGLRLAENFVEKVSLELSLKESNFNWGRWAKGREHSGRKLSIEDIVKIRH